MPPPRNERELLAWLIQPAQMKKLMNIVAEAIEGARKNPAFAEKFTTDLGIVIALTPPTMIGYLTLLDNVREMAREGDRPPIVFELLNQPLADGEMMVYMTSPLLEIPWVLKVGSRGEALTAQFAKLFAIQRGSKFVRKDN